MKTFKSTITFIFAIALIAVSTVSCSKASVEDEDALYENTQGVDRNKIWIPTNG